MAYLSTPDLGGITPTNVDEVYDMALQYGRILVGGANIQTHYDVFDKDFLEFGAMIADYKVVPNASTEVNPNSATFSAPKYNEILKLYFGDWNNRSYETSINNAEAHAVVNGQTSFDVFTAQIINSINEQEKLEKYQNYQEVLKGLMHYDTTSWVGELVNLNQYETMNFGSVTSDSKYVDYATKEFTEAAYQAVFREIRNVVDRMTFPGGSDSGGFNSAAALDDIYICAPIEFWNGGGVMWLAQAYHLEEAQVMGHIVKTNVGHIPYSDSATGFFGNTIYILHRRAIGRCVRYRDSMEQFVRQSWSRWFGQQVVDLYYFNKYEKAWAINMVAMSD